MANLEIPLAPPPSTGSELIQLYLLRKNYTCVSKREECERLLHVTTFLNTIIPQGAAAAVETGDGHATERSRPSKQVRFQESERGTRSSPPGSATGDDAQGPSVAVDQGTAGQGTAGSTNSPRRRWPRSAGAYHTSTTKDFFFSAYAPHHAAGTLTLDWSPVPSYAWIGALPDLDKSVRLLIWPGPWDGLAGSSDANTAIYRVVDLSYKLHRACEHANHLRDSLRLVARHIREVARAVCRMVAEAQAAAPERAWSADTGRYYQLRRSLAGRMGGLVDGADELAGALGVVEAYAAKLRDLAAKKLQRETTAPVAYRVHPGKLDAILSAVAVLRVAVDTFKDVRDAHRRCVVDPTGDFELPPQASTEQWLDGLYAVHAVLRRLADM